MDREKLLEYVAGYDRRQAEGIARKKAAADNARRLVPSLAEICRTYGARQVRLFGSLINYRYGPTPDIDLAVDGVPPERFFDLLSALQVQAAPVEVDLIDMATASPELRRSIESEGQTV